MEGLGCRFVVAATGVKSGVLMVTQEKGTWRLLILHSFVYLPLRETESRSQVSTVHGVGIRTWHGQLQAVGTRANWAESQQGKCVQGLGLGWLPLSTS